MTKDEGLRVRIRKERMPWSVQSGRTGEASPGLISRVRMSRIAQTVICHDDPSDTQPSIVVPKPVNLASSYRETCTLLRFKIRRVDAVSIKRSSDLRITAKH